MRIEIATAIDALNAENVAIDDQLNKNTVQIRNLAFALSDPRCISTAYSALACRIRDIRIPTAQAHNIAFETIRGANEQNIAALSALPQTSSGVLDTDECDRMIADLKAQNQVLTALRDSAASSKSSNGRALFGGYYSSAIYVNNGMIADMEAKKAAATEYEALSNSLYSGAEQVIADLLQKSTDSINSYLKTETYGDIGWTAGIGDSYKQSLLKQYDRYMLKLSEENPETAYLSDDFQCIYYQGQKWEIYDPTQSVERLGTESQPVYSANWMQYGALSLDTYEYFNLARFGANFGANMSDPKPKHYDDTGLGGGGVALTSGLSALSDVFGNAADSMERHNFDLCFEKNGAGGYRVQLLGRNEDYVNSHTWIGKNGTMGSIAAADVYDHITGSERYLTFGFEYDVVCRFDETRLDKNAYTHYYYFKEDGEMQTALVRYQEDEVEITTGFSFGERLDITDWYFGLNGDARDDFEKHIRKELGQ